jgi:hypothetical protein
MSVKRPSLADSMRQVAHPEPPVAAVPVPVPAAPAVASAAPRPAKASPAAKPTGFYAATRIGKKKVTVALDPATHKQFKTLGVEQERTTEALLQEAITDLFAKYGKGAAG